MDNRIISILIIISILSHGSLAAGPLCYSCFHYSRAENGENLQQAFQNDFGRSAPTIMAVFKIFRAFRTDFDAYLQNAGTVGAHTTNSEACSEALASMNTRRCATGQKCLSYTHAWKTSNLHSALGKRREWVMTWRDCVDATFDCDSSPMATLEAKCCTSDRCNDQRFNGQALLANARK